MRQNVPHSIRRVWSNWYLPRSRTVCDGAQLRAHTLSSGAHVNRQMKSTTFFQSIYGNIVLLFLLVSHTWGVQLMATEVDNERRCFTERQITSDACNHLLTNCGVWSAGGDWIYFDVRSAQDGSIFDGKRIERVHVGAKKVELVYESRQGACCGVVTACPVDDRVVFIHGPENPTADWSYSAYHRRGVLVDVGGKRIAENLDARDLVGPYTPGALRGGSHVHVFSGDGQWISFTYEDHVLSANQKDGAGRNQRNVGIAVPSLGPVSTPDAHPRNHSGIAFSVLVTTTADAPRRGSDEINRAYSDAWIGQNGYVRPDGSRQERALAFIGDVVSETGQTVPELFIVDLPDDPTRAGDHPLCGTDSTRPAAPRGVVQTRLTHTAGRKYPGLGAVRHWPRSSPDGRQIAFLMRDESGNEQLWTISPSGEDLQQLTHDSSPIESAFTWRPDGQAIACVAGGRVCEVDVTTGAIEPATPIRADVGAPRPEAVVYSPDGLMIAYARSVESGNGSFSQVFVANSGLAAKDSQSQNGQ